MRYQAALRPEEAGILPIGAASVNRLYTVFEIYFTIQVKAQNEFHSKRLT